MTTYMRQGECSWCGQCCTYEGYSGLSYGGAAPNGQPWPKHFIQDREHWDDVSFGDNVIFVQGGLNRIALEEPNGLLRFGNKKFYWLWDAEGQWVTDMPSYGDPNTVSKKCPFLEILRDDGSPSTSQDPCTRCGAVGTPAEFIFTGRCQLQPPASMTDAQLTDWQNSHPACSYTWIPQG